MDVTIMEVVKLHRRKFVFMPGSVWWRKFFLLEISDRKMQSKKKENINIVFIDLKKR